MNVRYINNFVNSIGEDVNVIGQQRQQKLITTNQILNTIAIFHTVFGFLKIQLGIQTYLGIHTYVLAYLFTYIGATRGLHRGLVHPQKIKDFF